MADDLSPNIILTGFMGTGKSEVGRRVATITGRTFVDLDAEIVAKHGAISDLFADGGDEYFRSIERETVTLFSPKRNQVISTGGGTMLDPDNVVSFLGAQVFTLTATPEEIEKRVTKDGVGSRPLLADADDLTSRIQTLLAEREEAYGKFTPVDTTGKSIDQVVDALRDAGANIPSEEIADPETSKKRTDKILYSAVAVAAVIAILLLILLLSF